MMTGYVHITGAEIPEDLRPESEHSAYGFTIDADCTTDSRLETVAMVHNLCRALAFEEKDYEILMMLAENPEGLQQYDFQIGGVWRQEDEEEE